MPVVLRWLLRLGPINPIAVRLVQGGSPPCLAPKRAQGVHPLKPYLQRLVSGERPREPL